MSLLSLFAALLGHVRNERDAARTIQATARLFAAGAQVGCTDRGRGSTVAFGEPHAAATFRIYVAQDGKPAEPFAGYWNKWSGQG